MNVRILSDLHLEWDNEDSDPGTGDVLILAGDICAIDIELMNDASGTISSSSRGVQISMIKCFIHLAIMNHMILYN